jgi:hypothetical protein
MDQLKKKCNVVILATEKATNLAFNKESNKVFPSEKFISKVAKEHGWAFQHLYILSDEKIKEGDWYFDKKSGVNKATSGFEFNEIELALGFNKNTTFKIVASTDKLVKYTNEDTDGVHEYLPSIPESFINKYIEEYNKGNVIKEVMVDYEFDYSNIYEKWDEEKGAYFIHKEQLKLRKDNTIILSKVKDTFTKEEMKRAFECGRNFQLTGENNFQELIDSL